MADDDKDLKKQLKKMKKKLEKIERKVDNNSAGIQQASQVIAAAPATEEEKQIATEEADNIKEEMKQSKELSLDQEFDLLLTKLTTQNGKYEPRLNSINRGSENTLKQTPGGLELAILLLRAEDNLNKISLNETWSSNINSIRRDPIINGLVTAVEETGDRMRSQGGFFRAHAVGAKESVKNTASSMLDVGRGVLGLEKKNRSTASEDAYQREGEYVDTSNVGKSGETGLGGGGRKTQRRKKHKKGGKYHKTRKHY